MQSNICRITVNKEKIISCSRGDNLYDVISGSGHIFIGNCGKRGTCNRCLVYDVGSGSYIRSCTYIVEGDMELRVDAASGDICSSYEGQCVKATEATPKRLGVAVDLGTTTVAMELVDLESESTIDVYSFMNPQIAYGSDVLSRIKHGSCACGLSELRSCIVKKLSEGIMCMLKSLMDKQQPYNMCESSSNLAGLVRRIVISGNTTMLAILNGFTLENLGAAPFTIKNGDMAEFKGDSFFGTTELCDAEVILLPNLSAFVGADVLSGALIKGVFRDAGYKLFADLGTNGELILANKHGGFATSCACGPAFEGILRRAGINGTNAFDMLSIMKFSGILNDDGVLSDRYIEAGYKMPDGNIIDMDMIHSFMLAKAAICAGVQALISSMDISVDEVKTLYIAGGFGCNLNMNSAVSLGLLPAELANKAEYAGNTSLQGARKCLTDIDFIGKMEKLKSLVTPINLGELSGFEKDYYSHMNLRRWSITQ